MSQNETTDPVGAAPCSVTFTTDLGAEVTVSIPVSDIPRFQRSFATYGWTSVTIPVGGLFLPYAIEEDFDWTLLGARKVIFGEDTRVYFRGEWYTRRVLREVEPTRKLPRGLPPAIKYSRGSRPTDDPRFVEKADGDIGMVPLVTFRGAGEHFKAHLVRPDTRHKYERSR